MITIYNLLTHFTSYILNVVTLFNPKIKLFVDGRKDVFTTLETQINSNDKTIWIHCASLGEFEQGLPIIEALKNEATAHKIIVTFFSPSGYEVKKNSNAADIITYLPLDTRQNAKRFLKIVQPELAIFVKYEFWPNYLTELQKQNIDTYLVSGIFREDQSFFKWYGKWMRKFLHTFQYFFVQNETSKTLLNQCNFTNVTVSGDTRFDRVLKILSQDNSLPFIDDFKNNTTTIVYGSSWPEDEAIYLNALNNGPENTKHIIAPHNINTQHIDNLKTQITKSVVLFSEMSGKNLSDYDVFIVDTIGLLTKIYSYADIAVVGGAFKTGLHNTLEPAVFGIPLIIGPEYGKFQEAVALVNRKGILVAPTKIEYQNHLERLINSDKLRAEIGHINSTYISENAGATSRILKHIYNT